MNFFRVSFKHSHECWETAWEMTIVFFIKLVIDIDWQGDFTH